MTKERTCATLIKNVCRYDSAHYKTLLKKNGVKVLPAMENIGSDPSGIILEAVLEGMAEHYSANLSQNVKRGMDDNASRCECTGGHRTLGYKIVKGGINDIFFREKLIDTFINKIILHNDKITIMYNAYDGDFFDYRNCFQPYLADQVMLKTIIHYFPFGFGVTVHF